MSGWLNPMPNVSTARPRADGSSAPACSQFPRVEPMDVTDRAEGISIQLTDIEEPFCIQWEDAERLAAALLRWVDPANKVLTK